MRKILPILLVTTALLTPLYPVYAQVPAPSVKRITKPTAASGSAAEKLQVAKDRMAAVPATTVAQDRLGTLADRLATRSAELKSKLARFRDKVKAQKIEQINTNLAEINQKRTTQMEASLNRIQAIVSKLKTWVAEQKTAGKDVSELEQAITDAEASWASAITAVQAQANNDYTIEVSTERTVKADAKESRDKLHNDLKMVHDKVVMLRKDLAEAISLRKGAK